MRTEYDFSHARRAKDVPELAALQARHASSAGKQRISIMLDAAIIEGFRQRAASCGMGYQTLINDTLRQALNPESAPVTLGMLRHELDARSHQANR